MEQDSNRVLRVNSTSSGSGPGGGGWARACDSCRSAPSAVYCHGDAAFLCPVCSARVHEANGFASRYERVSLCEACERAPAALNPLAGRHQYRVPVLPLPAGRLPGVSLVQPLVGAEPAIEDELGVDDDDEEEEEENCDREAATWLLIAKSCNQNCNETNLGKEVGEYLDLAEYNAHNDQCQCTEQQNQSYGKNEGSECLVPSHSLAANQHMLQQQQRHGMEMDDEMINSAGFHPTASLGHDVPIASIGMGIVPDSTIDVSATHFQTSNGFMEYPFMSLLPPPQMPPQFTAMDREARVLRYREKRKIRKFEKTIRYASRKACAEARPRIKGRFAKQ